jgi:hypothetical protein
MANINVENKYPKGPQVEESLVAASLVGYTRGLAVTYGADIFHAALVSVAGAQAIGIIEEDQIVPANATVPTVPLKVVEFGQAVAQIGATVASGQLLAANAAGQLVPAQPGQWVVALALDGNPNAGDYICVLVLAALGIKMQGQTATYITAAGAIPIADGTYVLNGAAALAMTLALPTAAQDGTRLVLIAGTSFAHTVTTPASGIMGTKHVVTYAAAYDICILEAVNTKWAVQYIGGPTPAALS